MLQVEITQSITLTDKEEAVARMAYKATLALRRKTSLNDISMKLEFITFMKKERDIGLKEAKDMADAVFNMLDKEGQQPAYPVRRDEIDESQNEPKNENWGQWAEPQNEPKNLGELLRSKSKSDMMQWADLGRHYDN